MLIIFFIYIYIYCIIVMVSILCYNVCIYTKRSNFQREKNIYDTVYVSKTMKFERWAITTSRHYIVYEWLEVLCGFGTWKMYKTKSKKGKEKEMLLLLLLNTCSKRESTLIIELYFNGLMYCRCCYRVYIYICWESERSELHNLIDFITISR